MVDNEDLRARNIARGKKRHCSMTGSEDVRRHSDARYTHPLTELQNTTNQPTQKEEWAYSQLQPEALKITKNIKYHNNID